MKIKIFHAVTMQDAMRAIKEELGPDAIILSSKEVREGGRLLRVFNRPVLEIMAAAEPGRQPPPQVKENRQPSERTAASVTASPPSPVALQTFQQTLQTILGPNRDEIRPPIDDSTASSQPTRRRTIRPGVRRLRLAITELNSLIQDLSPDKVHTTGRSVSPLLIAMRRSLLATGMYSSTVDLLVGEAHTTMAHEKAADGESVRHALHCAIARRIAASESLLAQRAHPAISLLLGPSGVGKTSAIAKLAAHYRAEHQKSVAVITFDTYRDAAVEQLRRYARLVGVPFACAMSARQVSEGLRRHTRVDLVLIDMPGIGQDDLLLANELVRLLPEESVTTHVVLPAFTGASEACRIAARFSHLPRPHLLFTKLDETESLGLLFEVAQQVGLPLSYWTVGRRVPGDIEVASSERLATLLTAPEAIGYQGVSRRSVRASVGTPAMTGVGAHRE